MQVVSVVDGEGEEQQPTYSTDMDATLRRKTFMAISECLGLHSVYTFERGMYTCNISLESKTFSMPN